MIIQDGTGSGVAVGATDNHRLLVDADSHDAVVTATVDGKSFGIGSGAITLTSANPSAILFFRNNEDSNLLIAAEGIRFQANQSTGGASGIPSWEVIRNPTAGTIVSGASAANVNNANFGSTRTLNVTAYKGAEGNTFTDGTVFTTHFGVPVPHRFFLLVSGFVIPRGASIGVRVTPPTGNTSLVVSASFRVYLNSRFFSSNP